MRARKSKAEIRISKVERKLEYFEGIEDGFYARDFVGAKEISFAERGEEREKGFGATDFFAKKFECVRQGMADWKAQCTQPKGVEKHGHLVAHTNRAVLQVAIIKAESGVEEDALDTIASRDLDLAGEIVPDLFDGVRAEIKIGNLAHVAALNVTNNDRGIVRCDQAIQFLRVRSAGEVQDVCAGFKAGAGNFQLVAFDRDENLSFAERADDG